MAVASFQELCAGLCEAYDLPTTQLEPDASGLVGFRVQLRNVEVTLVESSTGTVPAAYVLVEFGPLPASDELRALQALLNTNFMLLAPNAPAFSRNPMTGDILLQHACLLSDASVLGMAESIGYLVDLATQWRVDFFLDDQAESALPAASRDAPTSGTFA
jgi:hypothetical protein